MSTVATLAAIIARETVIVGRRKLWLVYELDWVRKACLREPDPANREVYTVRSSGHREYKAQFPAESSCAATTRDFWVGSGEFFATAKADRGLAGRLGGSSTDAIALVERVRRVHRER